MASLPADVLSAAVGTNLHWLRQLLACSSDEECPGGSPLLTSTLAVCDQTVLEECPQGNLLDKFHTVGWSGTATSSSNSSVAPLGYWIIACERTGAVTSSGRLSDKAACPLCCGGMPPEAPSPDVGASASASMACTSVVVGITTSSSNSLAAPLGYWLIACERTPGAVTFSGVT